MATRSRVILASTWAFEDDAAKEMREQLKSEASNADLGVEYNNNDNVFVIQGENLESSMSKFGSRMTDYIEDQRNKDLFDMPRVRRLEVSDIATVDEDTAEAPESEAQEKLLALDSDSGDDVTHTRCTKNWLSSGGGIGYFLHAPRDFLKEVGTLTGTEITVESQVKGLQASGKNPSDVQDALEKLTRLDSLLSLMTRPQINHILQVPESIVLRFQLDSYLNRNGGASPRILADPNVPLNAKLPQMSVTMALSFDSDKRGFAVTQHIKQPQSSNVTVMSRIWSDYKFLEIGDGARYVQLEAAIEKRETASASDAGDEATSGGNDDVSFEVAAREHPHLSLEKVRQVDRWVADAVENAAVEANTESPDVFPNESYQTKPPQENSVPEQKRIPGIKKRKVIAVAQPPMATPFEAPETVSSSAPLADPVEDKSDSPVEDKTDSSAKDVEPANLLQIPSPEEPATNFDAGSYLADDEMGNPTSEQTTPRNDEQSAIPELGTILPASPPKATGTQQVRTPHAAPLAPLLDLTSPAITVTSAHLNVLSFDQPALTPNTPKSVASTAAIMGNRDEEKSLLEFSVTSPEADSPKRENKSKTAYSEELAALKRMLQNLQLADQKAERKRSTSAEHPNSVADTNGLDEKKLGEPEEPEKGESMQEIDEVGTRKLHRTMDQKAATASEKATKKAEAKAKRQLTLEDAWGILPTVKKRLAPETTNKSDASPIESPTPAKGSANEASNESSAKSEIPPVKEGKEGGSGKQTSKDEEASQQIQKVEQAKFEEKIRELFATLKPALDAAQSFPGPVTLEMQVGLILLPSMPKAYKGDIISSEEWNKIFQPGNNVRAPSARFIRRVTSSGADADYILDLKASKRNGGGRLFDEEFSDYGVVYEYHCQTKDGRAIVVIIDEAGNVRIRESNAVLGAVHIHFPLHTWDASAILRGTMEYVRGVDSKLDSAIDDIVGSVWVQPERSLIRIFCRQPEGDSLRIDKVFMKRWTRHRYIRPGEASPAVAEKKVDTAPEEKQKSRGEDTAGGDAANDTDEHRPEIFLKITEVQDLFTGIHPADATVLRARCVTREEMVRKGRLWYEASIVSSSIEEILQSNASIELGENTDDWSSVDLLGNETHLAESKNSSNNVSTSPKQNPNPNPVAAAIGNTGLGEMYRVAKMVVERIDNIGHWDDSSHEAAATFAGGNTNNIGAAETGAEPDGPVPGPSSMMLVLAPKPKGRDFSELQSVKDLESASVRAAREENKESFW
ncbi:hypothetical protein VTN77DRAFT_5136 [Rasamsonia byssochlamydoides]|uniref:uncharacterized protein n=1 Tax=Rasamsonia byssochlamydoides TaxID=89139 RepID=UPI003744665F